MSHLAWAAFALCCFWAGVYLGVRAALWFVRSER